MTREEKTREIRYLKNEINSSKSALIRVYNELNRIGAITDANRLGSIIGKLEGWQAR